MRIVVCFVAYESTAFSSWVAELRDICPNDIELIFLCKDNSESEQAKSSVEDTCKLMNIWLHPDKGNIGYFAGLNTLLSAKIDGDVWVAGNYDLKPYHGFIDGIATSFKGEAIAMAVPLVFENDHIVPPLLANRHFSRLKLWLWEFKYFSYISFTFVEIASRIFRKILPIFGERSNIDFSEKKAVYCPHGSIYLINGKLITKGFMFPEANFLWHEEYLLAEYCYENNIPIIQIPDIRVVHLPHTSTKLIVGRKKFALMQRSLRNVLPILNRLVDSEGERVNSK